MTPEQEKEWKALSNNLKKYLSKGEIEVIRQFINKVEKEAMKYTASELRKIADGYYWDSLMKDKSTIMIHWDSICDIFQQDQQMSDKTEIPKDIFIREYPKGTRE